VDKRTMRRIARREIAEQIRLLLSYPDWLERVFEGCDPYDSRIQEVVCEIADRVECPNGSEAQAAPGDV
jgi:hypothetical protein